MKMCFLARGWTFAKMFIIWFGFFVPHNHQQVVHFSMQIICFGRAYRLHIRTLQILLILSFKVVEKSAGNDSFRSWDECRLVSRISVFNSSWVSLWILRSLENLFSLFSGKLNINILLDCFKSGEKLPI